MKDILSSFGCFDLKVDFFFSLFMYIYIIVYSKYCVSDKKYETKKKDRPECSSTYVKAKYIFYEIIAIQ